MTTTEEPLAAEVPIVEAPTEYNRREWKEVTAAFDELTEAIEGMKVPVENTDGDFIIQDEIMLGHETKGIVRFKNFKTPNSQSCYLYTIY